MAKETKAYRVMFTRSINSTAEFVVHAVSQKEALLAAGGLKDKLEWKDSVGEPQLVKIEVKGG